MKERLKNLIILYLGWRVKILRVKKCMVIIMLLPN